METKFKHGQRVRYRNRIGVIFKEGKYNIFLHNSGYLLDGAAPSIMPVGYRGYWCVDRELSKVKAIGGKPVVFKFPVKMMIEGWSALIGTDVKIGCQHFSTAAIRKIIPAMKKMGNTRIQLNEYYTAVAGNNMVFVDGTLIAASLIRRIVKALDKFK